MKSCYYNTPKIIILFLLCWYDSKLTDSLNWIIICIFCGQTENVQEKVLKLIVFNYVRNFHLRTVK